MPGQTEQLISELGRDFEFTVIIAEDEAKAAGMLNNYAAFDRNVRMYPARDPMFFKADIQGSYLSEQRTEVVRAVYEGTPTAIVTTLDAFYDEIASISGIKESLISIRTGDTVDIGDLAERLVKLGYEHESQVTGYGEFSVRGNIIDIFPYASIVPYRLDLFGDEVESIKIFDTESQRSVDSTDSMNIFPGGDGESSGSRSTFLNYFDGKKTLFAVCEPVRILKGVMGLDTLTADSGTDDMDIGSEISADRLNLAEKVLKDISGRSCMMLASIGGTAADIEPYRHFCVKARNIASYNGRFLEMVEDLKKYRKDGYRVIIECAGRTRAENMIKNLAENGVSIGFVEADPANKIKASDIQVRAGSARVGFEYPDIRFSLITEVDIFGARRNRKKKKRYTGDPIKEFTDLNVGDYVVHEQHGVGIYQGIERINVDGIEKDYMKIGYSGNASLYVLATQFDRIQKYGGGEGARPKLNRLGGKEWTATKERVRAAVQDIAGDLVRLYAARQQQNGFRYSSDTIWQREFEDSFEYEETDDQLRAIEAVKSDMESGKIMDRLICGDVGFGKTEIAIRAAFKAVQDGKQVAFLTPTTILAQQHYNTLCKRLANYPVTIEMLSRFVTGTRQSNVLKSMKEGRTDIVVGTHRLLSKDIRFRDLGLLIVDEEQRFGVTHKEKIKQLRQNVDVITLSATPIPRTLHMSLSGIRDMSLLTEPPVDRLPIQTYVMEYSENAVKEAITREIARGGQVYYLYNKTVNIDLAADKIRQMVPYANITYAHGKMNSKELEQIMFDFVDGQIDVLVSTTIIETGLDIPNVNTIIIHDADTFGLSQLYQLRGRVGRSNRTAYAFLMYRKDKLIKEVAEKRLRAIREFSELGSGIKIAMRDLEIRGAGNVLGAEQSGHMEAVGYELYCKMLNTAVAELKGEKAPAEDFETTVDLDIDGFIPASYIANESERLNMYKRISAIADADDLEDIRQEFRDRFGDVPTVINNLLTVALIKAKAHELYITEITNGRAQAFPGAAPLKKDEVRRKVFRITLLGNAPVDTYRMLDMLRERNDELKFVNDKAPYFLYAPVKPPVRLEDVRESLMGLFDVLRGIMEQ
ncbi:MAG: transcription-repair coupling factor [Parasporobacterium sp.]|nr:transcription-repair coupling factor [Parasporobacterium sp.]